MHTCNECEWWQLTSDPNWLEISPPRRGSPPPSPVSQAGGASSQARGGDRGSGTRGASVVELSTKFRTISSLKNLLVLRTQIGV